MRFQCTTQVSRIQVMRHPHILKNVEVSWSPPTVTMKCSLFKVIQSNEPWCRDNFRDFVACRRNTRPVLWTSVCRLVPWANLNITNPCKQNIYNSYIIIYISGLRTVWGSIGLLQCRWSRNVGINCRLELEILSVGHWDYLLYTWKHIVVSELDFLTQSIHFWVCITFCRSASQWTWLIIIIQ